MNTNYATDLTQRRKGKPTFLQERTERAEITGMPAAKGRREHKGFTMEARRHGGADFTGGNRASGEVRKMEAEKWGGRRAKQTESWQDRIMGRQKGDGSKILDGKIIRGSSAQAPSAWLTLVASVYYRHFAPTGA
jgi:hypothetical protein